MGTGLIPLRANIFIHSFKGLFFLFFQFTMKKKKRADTFSVWYVLLSAPAETLGQNLAF